MNCSKFAELFFKKHENDISEKDNELFEKHYNECDDCKMYYDDYIDMMDSLKNLEQLEPPKGLKENIINKVNKEKRSEKNLIRVDFKKYSTMVAMLVFAVIVFYPMISSFWEIQQIRQSISSAQQSKLNIVGAENGVSNDEPPTPMLRSVLPETTNDDAENSDANTGDLAASSQLFNSPYGVEKYNFDNYEVVDVSYIYIARNIDNFRYMIEEIHNNPKYTVDSLNINNDYYNITGSVEKEWYDQSKGYLEQSMLVDKTLNVNNIKYDVLEKKAEIQSYIDQMMWLESELQNDLSEYEKQIINKKLVEIQAELEFADDELSKMYEETQQVHFKILVEDMFSARGIIPVGDRVTNSIGKSMPHIIVISLVLLLSLIISSNIARKDVEKKYVMEKVYWYGFVGYLCVISIITFTYVPVKQLTMSVDYGDSGVIKYNTDLNFLEEEKIVINASDFDDYVLYLSELVTKENVTTVHETINNANISGGDLGYANFVVMVDKQQYENLYNEINLNNKHNIQVETIQPDGTVYKGLMEELETKEKEREKLLKELNQETELGLIVQIKQEIIQYDGDILNTQDKMQFINDNKNKILLNYTIRESEPKIIQTSQDLFNGVFTFIYILASDIAIVLIRALFPFILFYLAYKANDLIFDKYEEDKKNKKD